MQPHIIILFIAGFLCSNQFNILNCSAAKNGESISEKEANSKSTLIGSENMMDSDDNVETLLTEESNEKFKNFIEYLIRQNLYSKLNDQVTSSEENSYLSDDDNEEATQNDKRSPSYLRFGKRNGPAYLRFGRSQAYLRFGKRSPNTYLRFGKRNPAYLRFGKK